MEEWHLSIAASDREARRWIRDGESTQANAIVACTSFKQTRDMFVERFLRFLVDFSWRQTSFDERRDSRQTRRLIHMINMVYFVRNNTQRPISFAFTHVDIGNLYCSPIPRFCIIYVLGSTLVSTTFEQFTKQKVMPVLRKSFCSL